MTKARDLSSLANGVPNGLINLDSAEIPNLDASKITSGTFNDARISQSSVSQHATSFDDNKIVNDISTLALRQASDADRSAYNTNSQFVDVFQDDTGIDTTTDTVRNASEYVRAETTSTADTDVTINHSNFSTYLPLDTDRFCLIKNTSGQTFGGGDNANNLFNWDRSNTAVMSSSSNLNSNAVLQTSNESALWSAIFNNSVSTGQSTVAYLIENDDTSGIYNNRHTNFNYALPSGNSIRINGTGSARWRNGSGSFNAFRIYGVDSNKNGTQLGEHSSYSGGVVNNSTFNISLSSSTFYPAICILVQHTANNGYMFDTLSIPATVRQVTPVVSATGNFTGTTINALSSVSEMGAIITYQDNAGTNALNTDIVLELSADNGSNWSTATLNALPNFSTGIKMAKVNDLAVTAGTQLKYRINFANQSQGSKEARIRGVALQY
jgi:hypothetical protein